MKSIKLFMVLIASAVLFSQCGKDDETGPAPTISFPNGETGKTITVALLPYDLAAVATIAAEEEIATLVIEKKVGASKTTFDNATDDAKGKTSFTYTLIDSITAASFGTGTTIDYIFTATDKADQTTTFTYIVTLTGGTAPLNYTNKTLGSYNNVTGSFFATSDGKIYNITTAAANQTEIDFIYFYGATNKATIAAPDDADVNTISELNLNTWSSGNKNQTRFYISTITEAEFDAITDVSDINALTGFTLTKINKLDIDNDNKVVAFQTVGGKKGLIKVESITPGDNGTITISVKMQQ